METKTMESNPGNSGTEFVHEEDSSRVAVQTDTKGRPVSASAIIMALIVGYALGYFPPKRIAESSVPSVTAPVSVTAPAVPAPSGGGGCGV